MKQDKKDPTFLLDPHTLKRGKYTELDNGLPEGYRYVKKIMLDDGKIYYTKGQEDKYAIGSAASSLLYRDIGIDTPPIQIIKSKTDRKNEHTIIQPDVTQSPGIEAILARHDVEYKKIFLDFTIDNFKWRIFYDYGIREKFLEFMTPHCLEKLINIYLAAELRTDIDPTLNNYFLYRTPESILYEGIIAIDLAQMKIMQHLPSTRGEFINFRVTPYSSVGITQKEDYLSFVSRINDLRELLDEGLLSPYNLEMMIKLLRQNYPEYIKTLCKQHKIPRKLANKLYSSSAYLWEYTQDQFKDDLNL